MKAIIIDDELLPGQFLKEMILKHCFEIREITVFTSVNKAILNLKNNKYDLLFLDIEMPEMNSFDFLKRAMLPDSTKIIFVTAYSQYALRAFEADATHYLLKPVSKKELVDAVRRVSKIKRSEYLINKSSELKISIFDGDSYIVIDQKNIVRLEADGSYTKVTLEDGSKLLASKRLGHYSELLSSSLFFRCHKSHIINITQVYSYNRGKAGCITMKNKDQVPIASTNTDKLRDILGVN